MALKIRLRQQGRKNRLVYRLVLTESRNPRDGKYIEMLGWYNPHDKDDAKVCKVEEARVRHWLLQGAEITPKAKVLVSREAPEVIKEYHARRVEALAKACAKRKALRGKKQESQPKAAPAKKAAAKKPAAKKAPAKKAAAKKAPAKKAAAAAE